jgi:hypothetical protein
MRLDRSSLSFGICYLKKGRSPTRRNTFKTRGKLERDVLQIERYWNQAPGWFYNLPREQQIGLMADWRLAHSNPTTAKKADKDKKQALIRQKVQEYANRDRIGNG